MASGDPDPRRVLLAFVALGIVARAVRLVLRFPLWEDEAFLAVSVLDRDYAGLLDPLRFHQAAPVPFLWIQRAVVDVLGPSELALRAVPFAGSIVALLLFVRLSGRWLDGWPRVLAVAVLAVSYAGVRFGAEAKPYAVDMAASIGVLALHAEWRAVRTRGRAVLLVAGLAVAPIVSYGATIAAGAVVLLLARDAVRRQAGWPVAVAGAGVAAAGLGTSVLLSVPQRAAELAWMQRYWSDAMPPLGDPLRLAAWLVTTHTGHLLAVPVGGGNFASTTSALLVGAGAVLLARRSRPGLLLLCLLPFALQLVAAALGLYPYGGHVKFSMPLLAGICLLQGVALARLGHVRIVVAALAIVGLAIVARDVAFPYKTASDERARSFARWFWPEMERRGPVVCLHSDMGLAFTPAGRDELSWAATYLANARLYSPRMRSGEPPVLEPRPGRPLFVTEFRDGARPFDERAWRRWLAGMEERSRLTGTTTFPMTRFDKRERRLIQEDAVHLYVFEADAPAAARR